MSSKISLYYNTVRYLKLSQVYYRIFRYIKKILFERKLLTLRIPDSLPVNDAFDYLIPELDFDPDYLSRFNLDDLLSDRFTFINITEKIKLSEAWNGSTFQHLWRFNLHYFEYVFKLAYEYSKDNSQVQYYERFKYLIENWIENNSCPYGDGWQPYTISLRLTNWISAYCVFKNKIKFDVTFDNKIKKSIFLQYKYLHGNLEKNILGNHYIENIKALIVGSIFFYDDRIKKEAIKKLLMQLKEQVLNDGMHFELSPMYHKIILEDIIRITYWLKDEVIYSQLINYIQKMISVAYSFEVNFGKTPAFNDSADGISKVYTTILITCAKYFAIKPDYTESLEDSGFYIINNGDIKIIFDTGHIGPSYLPAHGHCDALSFELSVNGSPMLVNSGTYQYESGEWRNHFKSTKAHNTVSISDQEQSQFWSSFRIAKRITKAKRKVIKYSGIRFYTGSYVTCYGNRHKRLIGCIDEHNIIVLDSIEAGPKDNARSYLHMIPGTTVNVINNIAHLTHDNKKIEINAIGVEKIDIAQSWYSEQFNVKVENRMLIFEKDISRNYFGYMIHIGSDNYEIVDSRNELAITTDKEIIISYDELGDIQ